MDSKEWEKSGPWQGRESKFKMEGRKGLKSHLKEGGFYSTCDRSHRRVYSYVYSVNQSVVDWTSTPGSGTIVGTENTSAQKQPHQIPIFLELTFSMTTLTQRGLICSTFIKRALRFSVKNGRWEVRQLQRFLQEREKHESFLCFILQGRTPDVPLERRLVPLSG